MYDLLPTNYILRTYNNPYDGPAYAAGPFCIIISQNIYRKLFKIYLLFLRPTAIYNPLRSVNICPDPEIIFFLLKFLYLYGFQYPYLNLLKLSFLE